MTIAIAIIIKITATAMMDIEAESGPASRCIVGFELIRAGKLFAEYRSWPSLVMFAESLSVPTVAED